MATKSASSADAAKDDRPVAGTKSKATTPKLVEPGGIEPTLKVQLKKKEFFERVVERSGVRKGEAKTAVEAALAVLGEALADGEEVNLPPLGKIKVARHKPTPRGNVYNLRLVRNDAEIRPNRPLAEKDDDG